MRANRITAWLLTLAVFMTVLSGFSITAFAAETASGDCGENLPRTFDDTETLTISGTGAMADYGWKEDLPPVTILQENRLRQLSIAMQFIKVWKL